MSTYTNKDYGAANYGKFRPTYPQSLYDYLKEYAGPSVDMAVDLGCGTGQATRELAKIGKKVFGVDNSDVMINQAKKEGAPENVDFIVGNDTTISAQFKESSVDMLVVAEALHWMTFPDFWEAAHHILKPDGVLAFWSYYLFSLVDYPQVAEIISDFNLSKDKCGSYWDNGQDMLNDMYASVGLPENLFGSEVRHVNDFNKLRPEEPFELVCVLPLQNVFLLLRTWSAYHKWKKEHPNAPDIVDEAEKAIKTATGITDVSTPVKVKWCTVFSFSRAQKTKEVLV